MDMDEELESQIKAQVEEWSANSTECLTVEFVKGDGSVSASFTPEFTYPIFGEEEAIFGYQDLAINLSFAAHNLRPHLGISYRKKWQAQGEVKPTDIHEALKDFLANEAFSTVGRDKALEDEKAAGFKPPGEMVGDYTRDGQKYEIWCASLSDPSAKQLLENMQVLVPMHIEGGTMLVLEEEWTTERWKLFMLYRVDPPANSNSKISPYSLIGYGTSYRTFSLPGRQKHTEDDPNTFLSQPQPSDDLIGFESHDGPVSPLDLPSRERLSQFLILPPFQGQRHGQELYHAMYTHLIKPDNVREFTVEDPSEAFDNLRDLCDLRYVRAHFPEFAALRINTDIPANKLNPDAIIPIELIVDGAARERIMQDTKIMQRQFDRLVEMHTLSFIPASHRSRSRITRKEKSSNEHDKAYYFWRLYAKQRLYVFNREQLIQVEREERIEKIEAALDSVQEAYREMLERLVELEKKHPYMASTIEEANKSPSSKSKRSAKRRILDDDEDETARMEDEEDFEQDRAEVLPVNGHKKARVD